MESASNLIAWSDYAPLKRTSFGQDAYGFSQAVAVGDVLYVGLKAGEAGDIETQTAQAFDAFVGVLQCGGASMAELVNLRTYYVYQGAAGRDVTDYWERMTAVRLRYLADPGPAATAVRIKGAPQTGNLIAVDGIASLSADKQRIMPEHAWDWSIPTPFSQGWRANDAVYVGGQIAADRQGAALAIGDVRQQTKITLDYIAAVLADAGVSFDDVVSMRICYQAGVHDGNRCLAAILDVVRDQIAPHRPALSAFGVDLLYEGLMLEIDAVAKRGEATSLKPAGADDWVGHTDFPVGYRSGRDIYIGALSAPGAASLAAQAEATLDRLQRTLQAGAAKFEDLVKLTAFVVADPDDAAFGNEAAVIGEILAAHLPQPGPVLTIIQAAALPHQGQKFQLDAVASV